MVGQIVNNTASNWSALGDRILAGDPLTETEALSVLAADDDEVLDLLSAVYRIRRRYFGKTVQLYFLMNAKSGSARRIAVTVPSRKSPG